MLIGHQQKQQNLTNCAPNHNNRCTMNLSWISTVYTAGTNNYDNTIHRQAYWHSNSWLCEAELIPVCNSGIWYYVQDTQWSNSQKQFVDF